jgi:hypothetical protein
VRIQITEPLIIPFSPCAKYSSQYPVLKHPQSVFFLYCEIIFTPIQNNRQNSMKPSSVISYVSVELVPNMLENVSVCNVRGWYDKCCVHTLYLYTKVLSITAWHGEWSQTVRMPGPSRDHEGNSWTKLWFDYSNYYVLRQQIGRQGGLNWIIARGSIFNLHSISTCMQF